MRLPFKIIRNRKEPPIDPVIRAAQQVITGDDLKSFNTHKVIGQVITPIPPDQEVPYEKLKEARKYVIEPISPQEEKILIGSNDGIH
jgi:hypothetical protein